jgi:hypothetical protein
MTTPSSHLIPKPFLFLALPFELRQAIYTSTLSTTISLTDSRLTRCPALEEIAFLASRRGSWNLCLTCRLVYTETLRLRWENLTISLGRDGTRSEGDDGRHRLGNADQAFRRRVRHLDVSDSECFGMCYGLGRLDGLRTLTLRVGRVDGLVLEGKLMGDAPAGGKGGKGAKLRVEVGVVGAPAFEVGMFTSATTTSGEVQMLWRREAVRRGKRHAYLWLSDTIPHLPEGCQVTIQADVTITTWDVLKELDGFRVSSSGPDRWVLTYDEEGAL